MKKIIMVIVGIMVIFDCIGHAATDSEFYYCNLRKPLSFASDSGRREKDVISSSYDLLNKAKVAMENREYKNAINLCSEVVKRTANELQPPITHNKKEFTRIDLVAKTLLISAYSHNHDFAAAIELGEETLKLYPRDIRLRQALINTYTHCQRFGDGIKLAESTMRIFPQDVRVRTSLISLYTHAGRTEEAVKLGEETIKMPSSDVRVRQALIRAYFFNSSFNDAIRLGEETIRLFPGDMKIIPVLMASYIYTNKPLGAVRIGEKVIANGGTDLGIIQTLIEAYIYMDRLDEAIKLAEHGKRLFPDDIIITSLFVDAYICKAEKLLMLSKGVTDDIRSCYQEAINIARRASFPRAVSMRKWINERLQELSGKKRDFRRVDFGEVDINNQPYPIYDHVFVKHTEGAIDFEGTSFYNTFSSDIDNADIRELIRNTAAHGVNFASITQKDMCLPWWNPDSLAWYPKDDMPNLAEATGIIRMEARLGRAGDIVTAYPRIGEEGKIVTLKRHLRIDPSWINILPSRNAHFLYNVDSKKPILVLAGTYKWGMRVAVSNNQVFGNRIKLIWRECLIWNALWKGKFIGRKEENGNTLEVYEYDILEWVVKKYSLSNSRIYCYVDTDTRRFVDITGSVPQAIEEVPLELRLDPGSDDHSL